MTKLSFSVVDAFGDRRAAAPTLRLRLRVRAEGAPIDAMSLRVRVQIEPWESGRTLQWAEAAVMVGAFTDEAAFDIPIQCTYDLQVASSRYLAGLDRGTIPVRLFFNGTIFRGGEKGFEVEMLPWDLECTARLSPEVWRDAMDACFPDHAWIRLDHATFDALRHYAVERGLFGSNEVLAHLLAEAGVEPAKQPT